MEIIIGIGSAVLLEIIKVLTAKFGRNVAAYVIYAFLFLVAVVYVIASRVPNIQEAITSITTTMSSSVFMYEALIKRIEYLLPPLPTSDKPEAKVGDGQM